MNHEQSAPGTAPRSTPLPGSPVAASTDIDAIASDPDTSGPAGTAATWEETLAGPTPPNKKQIAGSRTAFSIGIALTLIFGTLLFDQIGPTTDRTAEITSRYTEKTRRSRGGTSTEYIVEGRDDRGGTFRTDLPRSVYTDASSGDDVVISRSILTGRVVEIDGPGWMLRSAGLLMWFSIVGVVFGLLVLWGSLRFSRRKYWPTAEPAGRRRHVIELGAWTAAVVIGLSIWVGMKRSEANLGGAVVAPSVTDVPDAASSGCDGVEGEVMDWMFTVTGDNRITVAEVSRLTATVNAFMPSCSTASVRAAVCSMVRSPQFTATRRIEVDMNACF